MTVLMTATALFLILLTGLLLNQGGAVYQKMMLQARADAVARVAAARQAEALGQLQTAQHLIGELLSWAAQPEALAGRTVSVADLPEIDQARARTLLGELEVLSGALQAIGLATPGGVTLGSPIDSGATTGQGKLRLLGRMVAHYQTRLAATLPPDPDEFVLIREWQALTDLENQARACLAAKRDLEERTLPAQIDEAHRIVDGSGAMVEARVAELAIPGRVRVGVWPGSPRLPVRAEAFDLNAPSLVPSLPDAILIRAAWPWVLHDRQPIRERLEPLRQSDAAALFDFWTVEATAAVARRLYERSRRPLYDYDPNAIGLLGLAHGRPAPTLASGLFPPPEIGGLLAHAQAVPHDDQPANRRTLLRWSSVVARYPALAPSPSPITLVTWRDRLVPVTLFDVAAPRLVEPFRTPAARIAPIPGAFQSH